MVEIFTIKRVAPWRLKNLHIEYKREAYAMFEYMMNNVRIAVMSLVVDYFNSHEFERKCERELEELNMVGPEDPEGASISQAVSSKVGRNDPCSCGSGKKYKKCCGQSL